MYPFRISQKSAASWLLKRSTSQNAGRHTHARLLSDFWEFQKDSGLTLGYFWMSCLTWENWALICEHFCSQILKSQITHTYTHQVYVIERFILNFWMFASRHHWVRMLVDTRKTFVWLLRISGFLVWLFTISECLWQSTSLGQNAGRHSQDYYNACRECTGRNSQKSARFSISPCK